MEEIIEKIASGEIKFHRISDFTEGDKTKAVEIRRKAIEKITGIDLSAIKPKTGTGIKKNEITENMIGYCELPLGIAGPIEVSGEFARGNFIIPCSTTEKGLIASLNRGCSAIKESSNRGVSVFIERDGITRAPVFEVQGGIKESRKFIDWVAKNFQKIKEQADRGSNYCRMQSIKPFTIGNKIFLRCEFTTGDAMGMNMVTFGCEKAGKFICRNTGAKLTALSGNVCADKKPAWINSILGRGATVLANAVILRKIVKTKLKTTPEKIVEVNWNKNFLGAALAGLSGFNAHAANSASAIFIATGQDLAHTVEASSAITFAEITDKGNLYISVKMPSLLVGTVGGGAEFETQKKCLEILGVAGTGNPPGTNRKKFAEIVAAVVLAGELSLLGAIANNDLAKAHLKARRNEL